MGVSDFVLLAKKIAVGILITLIPLGILTGGLWVSQKALKKNVQPIASQSVEVSHAN
jgi:uncharacterized protein YneF (UPF0154 family)